MKRAKIIDTLALLLFILGIIGLLMSFYFTKEYKNKIAFLEGQNKLLLEKIDSFNGNLTNLHTSFESFKDDNIASIKYMAAKIQVSEVEKKDIASQISALTKGIQDLQKNYSASLDEMNAKLESLKSTASASSVQEKSKVNLGQISVKKQKK